VCRIGKGALLASVSVTLSALVAAQAANAQSASDPASEAAGPSRLGDVVVTVRQRTERLQDVPVAVAATPKVRLQDSDATDLAEVGELAPQVISSTSDMGPRVPSMAPDATRGRPFSAGPERR
jgi:iron complex outermembrane receptor protein